MADRAARRAERERIKAKRAQYVWVRAGSPHRLGVAIDTPTLCSCEMCGNPRRYFGDRTIQERRHGWH